MSIQVFQHIKDAIRNLDPADIRRHTERPLRFFLYAEREPDYRAMEEFLVPASLSRGQTRRSPALDLPRFGQARSPANGNDLEIYFDDSGDLADQVLGAVYFRSRESAGA